MFCFFKQKTAYEMRISDWSSDVCSSDLPSVSNLTVQRIRASFTKRGIRLRYGSNAIVVRDFRLSHLGPNKARGDIPVGIGLYDDAHNVIGRASCREKVCSSGELLVFAV